ncbi:MAG: hypothetical protein QXG00_04390 [Candidatus Woesearchaeota archaeon]
MAGNVASALILFIASMFLATAVAVTVKTQYDKTTVSMKLEQARLNDELRTDITIDVVKYDSTLNTTDVYVKNTGNKEIDVNDIDVYINKERVPRNESNRTITILSDTMKFNNTLWDPKEVIQISIYNWSLNTDKLHELSIVTAVDVKDTYEFSI